MQKHDIEHNYKGSIDATVNITQRYGLRGLYLGFTPTLMREVMAFAIYFWVYERTMRCFVPEGKGSGSAQIGWALLAGSMAGLVSWLLPYPIDYVKT